MHLEARQASPGVSSDGTQPAWRGTRDGIGFVASWKEALLLEGRVWQITVGTMAAGGDATHIVGGGNGTTIDNDQPEFGVSVPVNTTLIPLRIDVACEALEDANDEVASILVIADNALAYANDGTVTTETPINLLDGHSTGGVATTATCLSAATGDITDPTVSMIIAAESLAMTGAEAAGFSAVPLSMHYEPNIPHMIAGPCAFYGYWGGTGAVSGLAVATWAEVPSSRFTLS